jgi:hypothetical protein
LREAVNLAYSYVCNPKLSGRNEFQEIYRHTVDEWLDEVG